MVKLLLFSFFWSIYFLFYAIWLHNLFKKKQQKHTLPKT